jgi:hypothetical protein
VASLICKELPLGSLLALRETCKTTREWVDVENKSTLTEALKEIQIELRMLSNLSRFLEEVPNLPFSSFSLNVQSVDNYRNRDVIQFMERYAPIIRRLSVSSFWKCASDSEWDFYEGLTVLEQLVINEMPLSSSGKARIPTCIQKLKLLEISSSEEEFGGENVIPYCFQLFETAKELETFTPCSVGYFDSLMDEETNDKSSLEKYLRHFIESWERRRAGLAREGVETLKAINWQHVGSYYELWFKHVQPLWLELIRKILNHPANIMMHRVSSSMLEFVQDEFQIQRRFADRIVSFGRVELFALNVEMPNLEVLWKVYNGYNVRHIDLVLDPYFSHPEWPKLKEIYTGNECGLGLDLVK